MTTYKYSKATYTRKYLGLSQARKIVSTFPFLDPSKAQLKQMGQILAQRDMNQLKKLLKSLKSM